MSDHHKQLSLFKTKTGIRVAHHLSVLSLSLRVAYRLAELICICLKNAVGVFLRKLFHPKDRLSQLKTLIERAICDSIQKMGPVPTKFGQVLSSRSDVLPASLCDLLAVLRDDCALPGGQFLKSVMAVLPPEVVEIDTQPIASGSIAVVFRGRTRTGLQIAVKIVRPGTRKRIEVDLAILKTCVPPLARISGFRDVPIGEIIEFLKERMLAQTSMIVEAENALKAISNRLCVDVIIPKPLYDICTNDVLVMEYIPRAFPASYSKFNTKLRETAINAVALEVFSMIFVHGFVHCDLHIGNLALSNNGLPIMYDFGLVANIAEVERKQFRDFFLAVATANSKGVAAIILNISPNTPVDKIDRECFERDIANILAGHVRRSAGEFDVLFFVREIFEVQRRHGVAVTPTFAAAIWALVVFEGIVKERHPRLEFQKIAMVAILRSYAAEIALSDSDLAREQAAR